MGPSGRRIARLLVFLVLACGVTSAAVWCAQGEEGPDAWERRHNELQPPEEVMDSIGVAPGMVIGEVGAGRGRYVVHMARRVGPTGTIFANDIDEEALEYLRFRCTRDSIGNVITVIGTVTDPRLPAGALDMVYLINTYHHLARPVELMRNVVPSLKPGGTLVIIEHDPIKHPRGAGSHATPFDSLLAQASEAGLELVRVAAFLPRDNISIFRPRVGAVR